MNKWLCALTSTLLLTATAPRVYAYAAIQNKADNTEIRIVPAPGPVTVDGDLKDWDLSGAILMFLDEASKDAYHVRAAMMYDKDYLYIGGVWKDPTPMMNMTHFGGDVQNAWNADAIQVRFLSDPSVKSGASTMYGGDRTMPAEEQKFINHINLWYSTQDQKAGYQASFTLKCSDGVLNPEGVQGAYVKDADGKGCTFEYRIPLKVLRAPRPYQGGDAVQMQFQIHWGNEKGTDLKTGLTDVRNPNSNTLGYMGPHGWGVGRFMATGNLPPVVKRVMDRADGHIPVAFTMEKDGKASISIRDAAGKTVRTGIGAVPYKAGEQTWMWDGLDDVDQPVPAGQYTVKILTHEGIGQKYIMNVGVSGTPPWQTEDGTGGWAGDYRSPLYVATEGDCVVLGTGNAEAAPYTIRTDLEGRKQWGTSASGLLLAVRNGFGYFGADVFGGDGKLTKFSLATGRLEPFADGRPNAEAPVKVGLAALDDATLVSADGTKKLFLIDSATGKQKGEVETPAPLTGGLAVDGKGTLYAVSKKAVGRLDTKTGTFTPLATELDGPRMLACDAEGNVYVSLGGTTMQVWKFSPQGKVLQKFGKPGGRPALGKFDPAGMLSPLGIAVDRNNRLWVCEIDPQPKRYSVWNADGTLYKEFFGSLPYSTTGYFDPKYPEYFYAECVRYRVDFDKGTWYPDATILRSRTENGVDLPAAHYHTGGGIVIREGRKFLLIPEMYNRSFAIYEEVNDAWVPRMAWSSMDEKSPKSWIDANGDGKVSEDEVSAGLSPAGKGPGLDLYRSLGPARVGNQAGVAMNEADDGCVYRLVGRGQELARGQRAQGAGCYVAKYSAKGEELWRYANVQDGFSWTSSAYTPGFVVGVMGISGFGGYTFGHPDLLPITGYYGQYFLIDKQDGLFVDALGQDQRSAYTMDHTFVGTENFNGTIFKHPKTGKTYFAGGDADCRIWELTGLDTIKRATVKVSVDDAMVAQAEKNAEQNRLAALSVQAKYAAGGRNAAALKRLAGAAADGKDTEWQGVAALPIGDNKDKPAQVQFGYDDQNLYVRFEVQLGVPFLNTPTDPKLLFKSGSALEICLTPHLPERKVGANNRHPMEVGDLRVLIARTKEGKLIATRYRPKIAAKEKPLAAFFETPAAGREEFDEIAEWNDLPMHYREVKGGCIVEVAIPWSATAVKPVKGAKFLLDAGVIYGNEGGTRNATRALWSDTTPEVNVNNDIPTESRMHPNGWGYVVLE